MPHRPLLCVDDESSNLATLRQLLRDDFPLVFAKSGGEALEAVLRHTPALILLDVELPDMDGYAVARTLKQQPASTCSVARRVLEPRSAAADNSHVAPHNTVRRGPVRSPSARTGAAPQPRVRCPPACPRPASRRHVIPITASSR